MTPQLSLKDSSYFSCHCVLFIEHMYDATQLFCSCLQTLTETFQFESNFQQIIPVEFLITDLITVHLSWFSSSSFLTICLLNYLFKKKKKKKGGNIKMTSVPQTFAICHSIKLTLANLKF